VSASFKAKDFVPVTKKVRSLIASYFDTYFDNKEQRHIEDYFRKTFEMGAAQAFHVFSKSDGNPPASLQRDYPMYRPIFARQNQKKHAFIIYYGLYLFCLLFAASRAGLISIMTPSSPFKPECIYLRKKDYYDLGLGKILMENLKTNHKKIMLIFFNRKKNEHGFEALNHQKGALLRSISSALMLIKLAPILVKILYKNAIPLIYIKRFIIDSFHAVNISKLKSKVITGVLLDKPIYVLIDYFKGQQTKTISLNESFLYPPFRTFDYNHLDIYLGTNTFESQYLNCHGGDIREIRHISFIRKKLKQNSKGLAPEITTKAKNYEKVILACTVQTERDYFWYFSIDELELFISELIVSAHHNPTYLFILKEKKGELSLIESALDDRLAHTKNIHVERSLKPRLKEFNHFEDLIHISDLCISMNSGSTILFQALTSGVPIIAINDVHPSSFLTEYEIVEMTSAEMTDGIKAWFDLDDEQAQSLMQKIKNNIDLDGKDGLEQAAEIINAYLV